MSHQRMTAGVLLTLALTGATGPGCPPLTGTRPPPEPMRPCSLTTFPATPRMQIVGDLVVKPYRFARLSVAGAPAGATLDWDVSPDDLVEVEEVGDRLLLVGPPGRYVVTVRAMSIKGGKFVSKRARAVVVIQGDAPRPSEPAPPTPPAPPGPGPGKRADPVAATARLYSSGAYCTVTPVWPRRSDGRWDLACAAHCVRGVGTGGKATFPDGRVVDLVCTAHNGKYGVAQSPDLAWFTTRRDDLVDLPFVHLAAKVPAIGTKVWQNGYGEHTNRRVYRGKLVSGIVDGGMLRFELAVSRGDSGGGIFADATGELLATVCCGPRDGSSCYGGACTILATMRPPVGPLPTALPDPPAPPSWPTLPIPCPPGICLP